VDLAISCGLLRLFTLKLKKNSTFLDSIRKKRFLNCCQKEDSRRQGILGAACHNMIRCG